MIASASSPGFMCRCCAVPAARAGYDAVTEEPHGAGAACGASGLADAGVGVEAAALQFGLHFAPLVEENYFLACLKSNLAHPAIVRLCTVLQGERWRGIL